ncbi:hypothetical protein XELAEV_18009532mg [Xenopus laevis]|uniref:Uncharacterized protein n=1 Tax=Xenopus laevis TaxID=8355 RepID=A0A974I149_XENLA|nr:hypothetical protein XELAEV_18009532mg [Xenopus laevis]
MPGCLPQIHVVISQYNLINFPEKLYSTSLILGHPLKFAYWQRQYLILSVLMLLANSESLASVDMGVAILLQLKQHFKCIVCNISSKTHLSATTRLVLFQ